MNDLNLEQMLELLDSRKTAAQKKALLAGDVGVDLTGLITGQPLLRDIQLTGYEDDLTKRLLVANHLLKKSCRVSLKPMLPLLLQLKGQPFMLHRHFPFEPFFRTRMAKSTLVKSGRQIGKSTSLAAQGVILANCIPYFSTLYITPLFEMIRRFSQNYVRPFIETSPVMKLFSGTQTTQSVLQKSFKNHSNLHFSFAFLDAERTRGISADKLAVDECQDIDITLLPVMQETMSGSEDWGLNQFTGTPKSLDNTIEKLWLRSSMAEWVIPCPRCGKENYPCLDHDLQDMIGPWHQEISETIPGTICAKCKRPINPRSGRWMHRYPERRWMTAGYHMPQIIFPMHYANPEKWSILLGKREGRGNTPLHVFFNEVCGESYDSGTKMVTLTDLRRAACLPWANRVEEAKEHLSEYIYRICCVDWGGGGTDSKGKADEKYRSFTTIAVMGILPGGQIHVIYGYRSLNPHAHAYEAKLVIGIMKNFRCSHLVHDFTGAGARQETIVRMSGLPLERIIPVTMIPACKGNIFQYRAPTALQPRWCYTCDKPRSLGMTCQLIKDGGIKFFQYEQDANAEEGLLHDFLHLIEDKRQGASGMESYAVLHDPSGPDDFASAVNIGTMTICQMSQMWPDMAKYADVTLAPEILEATMPSHMRDWDDLT